MNDFDVIRALQEIFSHIFSHTIYQSVLLYRTVPKRGYRSLTIKENVYEKFVHRVREAKRSNPDIENSKFLDLLLDKHKSK